MVRVPAFEFDGWRCEWEPRRGHSFSRGLERVRVRSNGAWKPGMDPVKHQEHLPARFLQVDRGVLALARTAVLGPRPLTGWGNNSDGGEQGGQGIDLHPRFTRTTLAALDGTIERHPIAAFHFDTGEPLTRDELGYSANYVLDSATVASNPPFQFAQFIGGGWPNPKVVTWQRIDVYHYCRAFNAAVAAWKARRDPVAFFWLQCCAHEVLRWLPTKPVTNGDSLYQRLRNLERVGHLGKMGVVRGRAHALRCIVEAARALTSAMSNEAQARQLADYEEWIRQAIDTEFLSQCANGSYTNNTVDEASSEQGQPWHVAQSNGQGGHFRTFLMHEGEAPSWQLCFLTVALAEAGKAVPNQLGRVRSILAGHRRIFAHCERVPDRYHSELRGLPYWLLVSQHGEILPEVTTGIGLADTSYDAAAFRAFAEVGL